MSACIPLKIRFETCDRHPPMPPHHQNCQAKGPCQGLPSHDFNFDNENIRIYFPKSFIISQNNAIFELDTDAALSCFPNL